MIDVTFYHHERADGGRRTGLLADGDRALEHFQPGGDEPDPTLLWNVTLTFSTDAPILSAADVARWLRQNGDRARRLLAEAADHLSAGMDLDLNGWTREGTDPEGPYRMAVAATRVLVAGDVGKRLRRLVESWDTLVGQLIPAAEVERAWAQG